jgi:hypothetical protein
VEYIYRLRLGVEVSSGDKTCWCKEENVRVICGKAQLLPGKMADYSSGHREPVNYQSLTWSTTSFASMGNLNLI